MSDIPSFTPQEMIKILKKRGFILDRVKGSHHIYFHSQSKRRVIVPLHKRDLPTGTFYEILKQAGIDKKELKKN
ncbi:MAG: type II toxin-antitoxin system HicA family toxin [Candidatus Aminicenantes bacterium]|nr:type II toxin-antitoxin system HicA family toxin [Candidatus Aminicenantes bacterium]